MNKKISSLAYGAAATGIASTPKMGNSTRGKRAVTGIGIASVIHHTAIRTATAAVFQPAGDNAGGAGRIRNIKKRIAPVSSPTR
jgi:hypothetical protein